jgi:superfamily II DNA or RNA helicase
MTRDQLKPHKVLRGPLSAEAVEVLVTVPMGDAVKLLGRGLQTSTVIDIILTDEKLELLETTPDTAPFDGDAKMFRLGIEAMRLQLAFEYDPYFSLSIARVDPLPHQLEAVYDCFLRLPRIRFLLADDPGAGKTIMAGLLIKELKIRGLVKRTLIITPASLSFQWQREMKDKFRENLEVIRSDILRANYGSNPCQDKNQVVTSVSWVSRIPDAKESLLRSQWDLVIVDEAHKMSAARRDKTTLAYDLGAEMAKRTDHYLLMTATPHKGDPKNFCLFLELLDRDIYGDVGSLEEALKRHEAPFYLRRVKEALVTFPDPDTGKVMTLFTKRNVQTTEFRISDQEWDFYDALTRYVEDQSIKAASEDSARGRALGFTMAMLQRRFASSTYAVRRSLERMKDKREKMLADPEAYRKEQINRRLPEDFEDLTDEERQAIVSELEELVASYDPATLRQEILELGQLIGQARQLEQSEVESKLTKLRQLLTEHGIFKDPKMKLLIFTEHKDTLDFLVGDGKDGRPLGKLNEWGLSATQIHGGMKVGDRGTPGTRIYSEREFREAAQVLVATEAAGEGINLQFCWFMINYDIPWNPVRLEQRMGRIVPEVIEDFFVQAAPTSGLQPKETREESKTYRIGKVPKQLWPIGERLEPRFGKLGREYKTIAFDKKHLENDPTLEWVTPGHPLFEAVREDLLDNAAPDLQRGAIFYGLHATAPYALDFFAPSVKDGRGNQIHRRLFAVQSEPCPSPTGASPSPVGTGEGGASAPGEGSGASFSPQPSAFSLSVKQPTVLLDLAVAPKSAKAPTDAGACLPARQATEHSLVQTALNPMLADVTAQRAKETQTISQHLEISLSELINRQQLRVAELSEMQDRGDTSQPLAANIKTTEDRLDELNARLEHRRAELDRERECMVGDIQHVARAWVVPHPERKTPHIAAMVSDPEIERIAVEFAIRHEEAQGRVVESVEKDNRGFDLISRKPHPEDPKTAIDVRFIEVKGRADTGDIALTTNEDNTAKRLKKDYYLYIVLHCATTPSLNTFQDPATLDWQAVTKIEHYRLRQDSIKHPVELREEPPPYRTGGAP